MKSACIVTVLAFVALACSSTSSKSSASSDPNKDGGNANDSGATESEAAASKDDGGGAPAVKCADTTGQQDCAACCADDNQKGATTYVTALQKCLCEADNCGAACKDSYCASSPTVPENGSDCAKCTQDKKNNCAQAVTSACSADADCGEFTACAAAAGCGDKT